LGVECGVGGLKGPGVGEQPARAQDFGALDPAAGLTIGGKLPIRQPAGFLKGPPRDERALWPVAVIFFSGLAPARGPPCCLGDRLPIAHGRTCCCCASALALPFVNAIIRERTHERTSRDCIRGSTPPNVGHWSHFSSDVSA